MSAMTLKRGLRTRSQLWRCPECLRPRNISPMITSTPRIGLERYLSGSECRFDEARKPTKKADDARMFPAQAEHDEELSAAASLPSKTHQRRWQISKRIARMMDELLARASVAGQHINVYTGTDYTGIEALRREIDEQERGVRDCHIEIDSARAAHHEAHAKQAGSQKEIVSLLERKSSWSPEDLERYMSLVRSEHTDEQAVQAAKDGLNTAERDLENARAELERLERKQYHEEQIWSDTIRRNSTWVTFGLMGVNIVLLLAQITIFEPYRRRKIVKDVNQALDEKTSVAPSLAVEKQVDEAIEPEGVPLEAVETAPIPEQPLGAYITGQQDSASGTLAPREVLTEESQAVSDLAVPISRQPGKQNAWSDRWEHYKEALQDLFSERIIQVKKVDVTTTALQGAATGVAAMGLLFVIWRPK